MVIDCNGIGYEVHISLHTYGQLGTEENIRLFTHLQVREDAHTLYGFYQPAERSGTLIDFDFRHRCKIARTMLSMTPEEIQHAIVQENWGQLKQLRGLDIKQPNAF